MGSLEALLSYLQTQKIPVREVGIGEVHKKDIRQAALMRDKGHPEYATILGFDIKVSAAAQQQAKNEGVKIVTDDIIYHLCEQFNTYVNQLKGQRKQDNRVKAAFPVVLEIDKQNVFRSKAPLIFGCKVLEGESRIGTPICVPEKEFVDIGRVGSMQKDRKNVEVAKVGEVVCIKMEQTKEQSHIEYGRHFDSSHRLYSKISQDSVEALEEHFSGEFDATLLRKMKGLFQIL